MCPPRMDPATVEAVTEHLRATVLAEMRELSGSLIGLATRVAVSECADMLEDALARLERDAHEAGR